ncbi:MAG: DivIVA domain-containing protein [Candidatus Limivicinus sp.]
MDQEFFDSIQIDVVKKKYYNANKVNALLEDIRAQAQALEAENQALRARMEEFSQRRDEIGETLLTAQAAARDIVAKAKVQAGRILADAQRQREEILSGATDQQEYAAACVGRTFDKLKRQQLANIETLNGLWQEFLCGLVPEPPKPAPEKQPVSDDKTRITELETMVNNIAKELSEIMGTAE